MSNNTLIVKNKYSGKVLQELTLHNENDIECMLEVATTLHNKGIIPKYQRIKILQQLADLVAKQQEEFAMLIANEGGKPLKDARIEVIRAIDGIHQAIAVLRTSSGKEVPMGITSASDDKTAFTTLEPIGVVVAISAFNHPLNLIIHQVVPAIATSCPMIIKPARATPLTCLKFAELVKQAGLPEKYLQVAITTSQIAEKLATDSKVAFLSFIGSSSVGWSLKSKLANGTRCGLEHGGVAPTILDNYQNIDRFIDGIVKASMYHSGQVCVSTQRLYVKQEIAQEIAEKIATKCEKLVIGDAIEKSTDIGPIIDKKSLKRIDSWVKEAIDEGATLVTGGEKFNDVAYKPTVLLNPDKNSKVSTKEIFGPVLCVYSYEDINEAINSANSLETAFQSAIFSDDITLAFNTAKKLQASSVIINDYTTFRVDWMPFTGRKSSGYGTGGIDYTIQDMQQEKMVVIGGLEPPTPAL